MKVLGGPPTAEDFSCVCNEWNWDGSFGSKVAVSRMRSNMHNWFEADIAPRHVDAFAA
jgi:hypothetical protein